MNQNMLLTVLVVVGFGCQHASVERDVHTAHSAPLRHEIPAAEAPVEGVEEETGVPIVAFTSLGQVVVFDGQTGEIKSAVPGGGGTPRDVAMDPWRKGVWV